MLAVFNRGLRYNLYIDPHEVDSDDGLSKQTKDQKANLICLSKRLADGFRPSVLGFE